MSVCKMFTFADESNFEEFEISGSTYEPIGDIFNGGKKVKGADFVALEEMATISIMCNDSALDFNDFKNIFEKVGEATETALITLLNSPETESLCPHTAHPRSPLVSETDPRCLSREHPREFLTVAPMSELELRRSP